VSDNPESDLVRALREIASAKNDESQFAIKRGEVVVQVSYSGGSSSSLTLCASYDKFAKRHAMGDPREGGTYRQSAVPRIISATRPMLITLRPEGLGDREAKQQGLNQEHQTGDEDFDRGVYIDSPTTDHDVLQAVLNEDVRVAVKTLFALGLRRITIDDAKKNVEAYLSEFATAKEEPDRAEKMLEAFSRMIVAMPPIRDGGGVHEPAPFGCLTAVGGFLAGIFFFAAIPLMFAIAAGADCTVSDDDGTSLKDGCGGPPLLGFVAGIVAGAVTAFVARKLMTSAIKGRSDSASRLWTLTFIAFMLTTELTFLVTTYLGYVTR
jgi:hypothetical protein